MSHNGCFFVQLMRFFIKNLINSETKKNYIKIQKLKKLYKNKQFLN